MLSNKTTSFFILLLIISVASCEYPISTREFDTKNSVVFIITSGLAKQKVFVFRTLQNDESIGSYPFGKLNDFIDENAAITVTGGNKTYNNFVIETYVNKNLSFDSRSTKYFTNATKLEILPSTVYMMEIVAEGNKISGKTETPGEFQILDLPPRDTLYIENREESKKIELRWTESENAAFYSVIRRIAINDTVDNFELSLDFDFPFSGSAPITAPREYTAIFPGKADSVRIDVVAYDNNSYRHFFEGEPSVGLENAFGIFGGATVSSITIIIKDKIN